MVAYLTRMPAGIPGNVNRLESAVITPEQADAAKAFPRYGMFGKFLAGAFVPLESGDAGADVVGLLQRVFPTNSSQDALGTSTPPTTGVLNNLRAGFMDVLLASGTAAKGGPVYVVTTAGGTVVVGDIVTSAAPAGGGTGVLVPRCFFQGPADTGGNTEIAFNV